MRIDRRSFLTCAGAGGAALLSRAQSAAPVKNWVWIPTRAARPADEWKRQFAVMRESGVHAVLPEIYAGKEAFFDSKGLPVKSDWLGTLLPIARAEGLEVHAWMWAMPCMIPSVMKEHPDWYNVNANGESAVDKPAYVPYYKFLDPGRPEVREFVQGTVKELAGVSELTGIHLDYIRHPDAILPRGLWKKYNIVQDRVYPPYDYGYSPYERNLFKRKYGADPMDIKDGRLQQEWLQFRLDMVTGLVNDYLVPAARAKGKVITAAVFPGPGIARTHVRQDWGRWRLDGFLPMLYHTFYEKGPQWVGEQTAEAVKTVSKPVYSGIFVGGMDGAELARTAGIARQAGASGVSLFSDGAMTPERWQVFRRAN